MGSNRGRNLWQKVGSNLFKKLRWNWNETIGIEWKELCIRKELMEGTDIEWERTEEGTYGTKWEGIYGRN